MTGRELADRLNAIAPGDAEALRRLGVELDTAVRDAPRAVVEEWNKPVDPSRAPIAALVALELSDLSMGAELEVSEAQTAARLTQTMRAVVQTLASLRSRQVSMLAPLLEDSTDIGPVGTDDKGASGPAVRMCDHAYGLVRRLAHADDAERALGGGTVVLVLSKSERDAEIRRWKQSKMWQALLAHERGP